MPKYKLLPRFILIHMWVDMYIYHRIHMYIYIYTFVHILPFTLTCCNIKRCCYKIGSSNARLQRLPSPIKVNKNTKTTVLLAKKNNKKVVAGNYLRLMWNRQNAAKFKTARCRCKQTIYICVCKYECVCIWMYIVMQIFKVNKEKVSKPNLITNRNVEF